MSNEKREILITAQKEGENGDWAIRSALAGHMSPQEICNVLGAMRAGLEKMATDICKQSGNPPELALAEMEKGRQTSLADYEKSTPYINGEPNGGSNHVGDGKQTSAEDRFNN